MLVKSFSVKDIPTKGFQKNAGKSIDKQTSRSPEEITNNNNNNIVIDHVYEVTQKVMNWKRLREMYLC
jgi:hypothetical protein